MAITKFNRNQSVKWDVSTEGYRYVKLRELLPGEVYPLFGCYITKDNGYGEGAVLISKDILVNIPERYVDVCRAMMSDDETIADIKAGKCGFKYTEFTSKTHHRIGFSIEFVEI